MPIFKSRAVFEIARGVRAFLNLDAGLTHGETPDFEQMFKQAQTQAGQYRRQLERTRKQLADKDRELQQVRQQLADRTQRDAGQQLQSDVAQSRETRTDSALEANRKALVADHTSGVNISLPSPPDDLCMRVGGPSGEAFHTLGSKLAADLYKAFPSDFSWKDARVLDFGCGVGRVLRHFAGYADQWGEFWGCDIHEESIAWLKANLSPPFQFVENSEDPPLPFEDNYFDLIYGISVFTHLTEEKWAGWLEELRRITRPGGTIILTYHGRIAYERKLERPFHEEAVGMEVHGHNTDWERGGPRVYHSDWWIRENWGKYLAIERLIDHGLQNWQSIAVMHKDKAIRDAP